MIPGSNAWLFKKLHGFSRLSWWLQWFFVSCLALILYAPILSNSFVSDDFIVLKKVCLDRQLNTNGFFRPLSDITLYLNYLVGGFNPAGYYLTHILVHALDTLLLFHFCRLWKWTSNTDRQVLFAGIAGLLFLTYPFHSEPVVWILGRAALMANTFAMLALVIMVSKTRESWKITGVAICYFIAMSGYESVMVLPAIMFLWLLYMRAPVRRLFTWMLVMAVVLLLHIWVRIVVSGSLTGTYGEGFFGQNKFLLYASNIGKVSGRLLLPPVDNNTLLIVLFGLLFICIGWILYLFWKKAKNESQARSFFIQAILMLLVTLLVPVLFNVSTHTTESDRFLHFPSFFLCLLTALIITTLLYNSKWLYLCLAGLLVYNITFLQLTLQNWRKASAAVNGILHIIKSNKSAGKIYIINMPEEIDGAYVFRLGFPEALQVNNLDSSRVKVVNFIKRDVLITLSPVIEPVKTTTGTVIPPGISIQQEPHIITTNEGAGVTLPLKASDQVVFWNKKQWITL